MDKPVALPLMMAATPPVTVLPLLVSVKRLSFDGRGHRAIDDVSLQLSARSTFILGPNGAGKSVLLRLLHGLLKPSAGEVLWEPVLAASLPELPAGAALGGANHMAVRAASAASTAAAHAAPVAPARMPRLAMVFQRPVMLRRSVLDNVIYGMAVNGGNERVQPGAPRHGQQSAPGDARHGTRGDAQARAHKVLARVGLAHLAQRPARVLSGGEQQRVALARAWALRPDVLLLDEPTASLDPHAVRAVEAIIGEIVAGGTAIIMTTHHRGVARRLAEDVIFLHQGRAAEQTSAAQFFDQPVSRPGRDFLRGELE